MVLTTALNYVVGIYAGKVLRDFDILPLQGFQWVSDQLLDCWATVLERRFSVPEQQSSVGAFPLREFTAITSADNCETLLRSRNVSVDPSATQSHSLTFLQNQWVYCRLGFLTSATKMC